MTIRVLRFEPGFAQEWDEFCGRAINSTLMHTRNFLGYHGSRFSDESLMLLDQDCLVGIFPAARSNLDLGTVVSHPGSTYGGVVHGGKLLGAQMLQAINAIVDHYAAIGYQKLLYKAIPYVYTRVPSQDDLYALFCLGAKRVRCDLSCSVDLRRQRNLNERRRRGIKKAQASVRIHFDTKDLLKVWQIIQQTLARRYGALPTHSFEELCGLKARFPMEIEIVSASVNDVIEATVILFNSPNVWHAQYIAATEVGYKFSALDGIFSALINKARELDIRYFDFGTSNEDNGKYLNESLYRFKAEFGGGGVVHEFYELELKREL